MRPMRDRDWQAMEVRSSSFPPVRVRETRHCARPGNVRPVLSGVYGVTGGEPGDQPVDRLRSGEIIALRAVAAYLLQDGALLGGLDALGDDLAVHLMGNRGDAFDQHAVLLPDIAVVADGAYE